jgi:hypothetical protein
MSDMPSYDKNKAAIKQRETFLTSNGGAGQTPCSPRQSPPARRPLNHVDPGTGKRS